MGGGLGRLLGLSGARGAVPGSEWGSEASQEEKTGSPTVTCSPWGQREPRPTPSGTQWGCNDVISLKDTQRRGGGDGRHSCAGPGPRLHSAVLGHVRDKFKHPREKNARQAFDEGLARAGTAQGQAVSRGLAGSSGAARPGHSLLRPQHTCPLHLSHRTDPCT